MGGIGFMIARHWRGWTKPENADAYEDLLKRKVLPGLKGIDGYQGGYVLRRSCNGEVEFVVVNFFDSIVAVERFAGANYAIPVFEPEAKALLSRAEPVAAHYEVRANTV
jgi:heme-degrading monooxygenase HmoA